MNREQFDGHGLWATVDGAALTMGDIDATKDIEAIRSLDEFRRLITVTREVGACDPELVTDVMLSRLNSGWAQVQSNLAAYQSNPNPQYLAGAVAQGDVIRDALAIIPKPVAHGPAQASVTRGFNAYREELDASRDRIAARLDTVLAEAEGRRADLAAQANQFIDEVARRDTELHMLEERIAQSVQQMANYATTQAETFTSAQTGREADFRTWLKEREVNFDSLATPHVTSLKNSSTEGKRYLDEIEALRTTTVEMSGLAAGDILATKYGDYASSERKTAFWAYFFGAVAALSGLGSIAFLFGSVVTTMSWQQVALKLGVTLGASGIAAVAFRTGGLAIRRATSFKRQELELRALQPFLKDVDGADSAKTAFLERAFGHAWLDESPRKRTEPDSTVDVMKALIFLSQQAQKVVQ